MPVASIRWLDKDRAHILLSICYMVFIGQLLIDIEMAQGGQVARPSVAAKCLLTPFVYTLHDVVTKGWTTAARCFDHHHHTCKQSITTTSYSHLSFPNSVHRRYLHKMPSLNRTLKPGYLLVPIFDESNSHFIAYNAPDFTKDEATWGTFNRLTNTWPFESFSIIEDAATTTMVHYFGIKKYKMATDFIAYLPTDVHRASLHTFQPWIRFRKDTEKDIRNILNNPDYNLELIARDLRDVSYRLPHDGEAKTSEPLPSTTPQVLMEILDDHTSTLMTAIGFKIKDHLFSGIHLAKPNWTQREILQRIMSIMNEWVNNLPPPDTPSYQLESTIINHLIICVNSACGDELRMESITSPSPPQPMPDADNHPDDPNGDILNQEHPHNNQQTAEIEHHHQTTPSRQPSDSWSSWLQSPTQSELEVLMASNVLAPNNLMENENNINDPTGSEFTFPGIQRASTASVENLFNALYPPRESPSFHSTGAASNPFATSDH